MQVTPEIQSIIDQEVSKREMLLENKYKEHFDNLKTEMFETMNEYVSEALSQKIQLESIDSTCETVIYKPIVESIVGLLNNNGIKVNLQESISDSEIKETKDLLMEAVKKIQELRDMIKLHEMIEQSLTGMNRNVIESALNRFKNDSKYDNMPKDDLLKEVVKYVSNLKDVSNSKGVQFESRSEEIDTSSLDELDTILKNKVETTDPFTSPFNPSHRINISKLKRKVLDEANYVKPISNTKKDFDDPAQEVLDILGM